MTIMPVETLAKVAGGKPDQSNMTSVSAGIERNPRGLERPHRMAHYLCQLLHESVRFRYDEEIWGPTPAQRRYEDRADLGHSPAIPNEAFTFRGRTGIQMTGRHNYRAFTDWCRRVVDPKAPDFEANPDQVNTDPWEGLCPIWYWDEGNPTGKSLNRYADSNNIEAVTRKINGGLNGYSDRLQLYTRAALTLIGYPMVQGVVRRFQEDMGNIDVDDIAGEETRGAMHAVLLTMPNLGAKPKPGPEPEPIDLTPEVEKARAFIREADQVLAGLLKEN